MILSSTTKLVSSQLFGCSRAKLGPLGRGNLYHLLFIIELLVVWPIGHIDPYITDWVTKPTISFIIFWDFSMSYQIFLSTQVKRWAIITYKHGIYELPHELPKNLRLEILGNKEISGICLNLIKWYPRAQYSCQNKSFVNTSRKLLKNRT